MVVSLGIVTLLFGGILNAYIQSSRQAEWAGYSLAAQAIGIQQIEQARSGVWDYSISKNELTNLNLSLLEIQCDDEGGNGLLNHRARPAQSRERTSSSQPIS